MSLTPKIDGRFERYIRDLLKRSFTRTDFFTLSEVAKYNPAQDKTAWEQRNEKIPEVCEVYHKGEFICDLHSKMSPDEMVNKVWNVLRLKKIGGEKK